MRSTLLYAHTIQKKLNQQKDSALIKLRFILIFMVLWLRYHPSIDLLTWIACCTGQAIILIIKVTKASLFYDGQYMKVSHNQNTIVCNHDNKQAAANALKKFRVIYGTVRQHFREVEQNCGVSGSQLWLLQEIHRTQNIGVSELAGRLSIHQSTCSQLVDKLVKAQLVIKQRSLEDQRRVGLCITEQAVAILARAPGPAEGVLPGALNAMPLEVLNQLDILLDKVIQQLGVRGQRLESLPLADM